MVGDIISLVMMVMMLAPNLSVRLIAKRDALGFSLRNILFLSIFNIVISGCFPKTMVFLQMMGLTLHSDADKMCISSFSHGLQSNALPLPVHPLLGQIVLPDLTRNTWKRALSIVQPLLPFELEGEAHSDCHSDMRRTNCIMSSLLFPAEHYVISI